MKKLIVWESIGTVFVILAGTLLHSAYAHNDYWLLAIISPVNESLWEHLKIAIWPVLFFAVIEYPFIRSSTKNFLTAKVAQTYAAVILIFAMFYGYTSVLGGNLLPLDILIFIIAVAAGQYLSYRILSMPELDEAWGHTALYALYFLLGAVIYATYLPPRLPAFQDPVTGQFGMPAKRKFLESALFIGKNTLLAILVILIAFFVVNITTPFRIWSMGRKMDKIISLLEKISKK